MRIEFWAASAAAAALCLFSGEVLAQQAAQQASPPPPENGVAEIIVTAQHRRENSQSVPISLTAVSGDALARTNVASLQDLAGTVPGMVVSKSISYGLAPISIRGLGGPSGGGSLFTDQPVAVYVDGVYVPALAQSVSDFLDLDSVQVLRGPQGTLYGRNSTAGAVLMTGKRPDLDAIGGYVRGSYASYDDARVSGAINLPIVTDELALRVAVGHNGGGNWAHNTIDNRSFGGGDSTSERASLRFRPANGPTLDLIIDHSQGTSNPATLSLASVFPINTGPALGTVYAGDPYARRADYAAALGSRAVSVIGPQFTNTDATDISFLADWAWGGVTLTSITGYRKFHVNGAQDVTPAGTSGLAATNTNNTDQRQESFSQELRLASNDKGPLKWTVGAYYFHQNTNSYIDIINLQGGPPVATGFGAQGPIFTGMPSGTTASFQGSQKVDSLAAFADATYKITDQLSATGGVRYSRDDKHAVINNTVDTITNSALAGPVLLSASCPSAAVNCAGTYSNVSPRAVLNYQATRANMVFASFAKGFNAGGFNNFGNVAAPTDPTNPLANASETITSYEIGSKNDFFDHALRINLSAFLTDYDNLAIRQAVLTGGVAIVNVPKARVKGLEFEGTLALVRGLTLKTNATYLDARIVDGTLAALPTSTGVIVLGQNTPIISQDVSGNSLTRSPRWQGYASLNYSQPVAVGSLSGSVTWKGQTKSYFLETNQDSNQYVGGGWSEVDLRLALAGNRDKWEVALFGQNILNNRHISQIVPFTGFPFATLNTPVTWGVSGLFKF